jgi:protein gp37
MRGKRVIAADWQQPLAWDKAAAATGVRRRVFCGSMCDVFEDRADLIEPRAALFDLINGTPNLDWILLTKRPENIRRMIGPATARVLGLPSNLWLGTSIEDQRAADERIPHLLTCRDLAPVLFLSCEPLVGPIDFTVKCPPAFQPTLRSDRINWVILGGESGPKARPGNVDWIRSIIRQCRAAGVPCFVKQLGGNPFDGYRQGYVLMKRTMSLNDPKGGDPDEWPKDLRVREFPEGRMSIAQSETMRAKWDRV